MKLKNIKSQLKSMRIFALAAAALTLSSFSFAGFSTSGTQVLDGNGNPFLFRGVNHAHTWYKSSTQNALSDIASVKANSVRVVLSNGTHGEGWIRDSAQDVAKIIEQCKANKLICMLEIHDSTGYSEKAGATHMSNAIDYWLDIASILKGEEDYIIINLANEPFGNTASASDWINGSSEGIQRLRNAGLNHTLVVDAPSWGQDWQGFMRDNAQEVIDSDPQNNLIFSVHMYEVYQNRSTIENYVSNFLNKYNVPLIVGEFGADHQGKFVDADSIMAIAEQYNIGYLGWSWSGNGGCCTALDMVSGFNVNNLTVWGEKIINGANGIRETSQIASIYGGGGPLPTSAPTPTPTGPGVTPTPTPTTTPVPGTGISCEITNVNDWGNGYQLSVKVTNNGSSSVSSWSIQLNYSEAPMVTSSWNAQVSESGNTVTASNSDWNGSLAPGQSASFGIQGDADGSFSPPTCNGPATTGPTPVSTPQATPTPVPSPTPKVTPTPAPSTPTPEPTAIPTPVTGTSGIVCEVTNASAWSSGYQVDIEVTNTGSSTVSSWEVLVSFPEGANRTGGWNADFSDSGKNVIASNMSWNGSLSPGASASFGFQGSHDGSFEEPTCAPN